MLKKDESKTSDARDRCRHEVNFEHSLLMVRVDIINTTMDLGVVTKGIRDLSFWLRKLSSISIKRFSN